MKQLKFFAMALPLMLAAITMRAEVMPADTTVSEKEVYSDGKYNVEVNSFWTNWFISAGGGAQVYLGDHDKQAKFGDRLAPNLDIAVGKWITPGIGFRLMYSGLSAKGVTVAPEMATDNVAGWTSAHATGTKITGKNGETYLEKAKFNMANFHVDALFNLSNMIGGYKDGRFWNFSPYVGIGYATVFDSPREHAVSANGGILNSFRLCDALDINLDIRGALLNDSFDGEEGGRSGEGLLSASLGLCYKFKPRGWNRSKTVYRTAYVEDSQYHDRIVEQERDRLAKELADLRTQKGQTIVKSDTTVVHEWQASPYYVVFALGKSELTKASRVNLGILAELIKECDEPFKITGYADSSTGSQKVNDRLSRERAEAVYDCLVKEFGVPESLLSVESKGGVGNMYYDDPALSRAAIVQKVSK